MAVHTAQALLAQATASLVTAGSLSVYLPADIRMQLPAGGRVHGAMRLGARRGGAVWTCRSLPLASDLGKSPLGAMC